MIHKLQYRGRNPPWLDCQHRALFTDKRLGEKEALRLSKLYPGGAWVYRCVPLFDSVSVNTKEGNCNDMAAGKVDYDNLLRNTQEREKRIRWRRLQSKIDYKTNIFFFGYCARPSVTPSGTSSGPWFGYTKGMLQDAPCHHCGRVGVFAGPMWAHECPAVSHGKPLPCQDSHPCKGEPSMATAPMWRDADWIEVPICGFDIESQG